MQTLKALTLCLILAITAGCTTNPETGNRQFDRVAVGVGVGLIAGGLVGAALGDTQYVYAGAALGAAIGGGGGYLLEQRAKRLEADLANSSIEVARQANTATGAMELVLKAPADVTFTSGSAALESSAYADLMRVAAALRDAPGLSILVVGHTDNRGSLELNEKLSLARAESVATFLSAAGIPSTAFHVKGAGYSAPVASNDTEEGRRKNRRVEIRLTEASK